ncbi:MAG: VIT1/CCC1 transporter family protein [Candidatus Bathyarchaeia archaeon]|jgi:predicted membrane protein (TIGR00267 family)
MSTEHVERMAKRNLERGERWHKKLSIKEIVFGFQDNSIAILALLAGVTGGSLQRGQILLAGLAAVVAGAIAVAIGSYISSKSELEYFESEINRESREIEGKLPVEREEVRQIYMKKAAFTENELSLIVNRITSDKKAWLDTMTRDELGLAKERFVHPLKAALVMMGAETIGGLVPLTPYLITPNVQTGFMGGIVVTFASLFAIGVWKTTFTKKNKLRSGLEMVVAGTLATVVPYFIGNFLSSLALPI